MTRALGFARRVKNGLNKRLARKVLPFVLRPQAAGLQLEALGEGDGAWVVPTNLIRPEWVCYCVGVGVNATFDLELARRFSCNVHSFDPTPRSIAYIESLGADGKLLHFHPLGVWKEDADLRFFAPACAQHVNYSVVDLHGTGDFFVARCRRLSTHMRELGHERIDLLKLDIEGSWREVLTSIIADEIPLSVLCIEFDSPTSLVKIRGALADLRSFGFELVHFNRENYTFCHHALLPLVGQ
jgi:FkbM family methyltransferase